MTCSSFWRQSLREFARGGLEGGGISDGHSEKESGVSEMEKERESDFEKEESTSKSDEDRWKLSGWDKEGEEGGERESATPSGFLTEARHCACPTLSLSFLAIALTPSATDGNRDSSARRDWKAITASRASFSSINSASENPTTDLVRVSEGNRIRTRARKQSQTFCRDLSSGNEVLLGATFRNRTRLRKGGLETFPSSTLIDETVLNEMVSGAEMIISSSTNECHQNEML